MTVQAERQAAVAAEVQHSHARPLEWIGLIAGFVAIVAVVSPPFDDLADRALSMHMLQHMVLINVGAPLLAIAWPLVLGRLWSTRLVGVLNSLARPLPALAIATATLWIWHLPLIYDAALENNGIHALEHLSLIAAFVLFWRPLMNDSVTRGHLQSNGSRVFYLSAGMLAMGVLGAIITFDSHLIYTFYAGSTFFGRSPLTDQHLGGAIMMLAGTIAMVVAGLVTMSDE